MTVEQLIPLALLVFGLLFGSFANVVVWRFPRGESVVQPGSHCPSCGNPVRWHDNIPVLSWFLLRGRCRDCAESISARYPLIEALSGALWLVMALRFGTEPRLFVAILFAYLLMILAFIDLDTMRLPNPLVAALAVIGALAAVLSQVLPDAMQPLISSAEAGFKASPIAWALIGAVLGMAPVALLAGAYGKVRGRSGLGMGDVKLLGAMGLFLGPLVLLALLFGSLAGSIAGVVAMRRGAGAGTTRIPFGPYLAAGGLLAAVAGPGAWAWYLGLLGR